jgi:tryptophanyl-tRNA synthetase
MICIKGTRHKAQGTRHNVLTGIKSTGTPHLGHVIGIIHPTLELFKTNYYNNKIILIANLHTLTNLEQVKKNPVNSYKVLAAWLACGLSYKQVICYRQSDLPETTELLWFFSSIFPLNRLKLGHSYKEYKTNNESINAALLLYPLLMAADILISKSDLLIIGKDQLQHLEIARKIANKINKINKIFPLPSANIITNIIKGTDGNKMSKSKNNVINIFSSKEKIKNKIFKIKTQRFFLDEEESLLKDNLYNIYQNFIDSKKIKRNFRLGYFFAKQELYRFLLRKFKKERILFNYYINNKNILENILKIGALKMKQIIKPTMKKLRKTFGLF